MAEISSSVPFKNNLSQIPMEVNFSEEVSNFSATSLIVKNGSLINFSGSGAHYTFDIIPAGDGMVSVEFVKDFLQTTAGETVVPSGKSTFDVDHTSPTVSLSSTSEPATTVAAIPVKVTFSETVVRPQIADFQVNNGYITSVSGSGSIYTLTLNAIAPGTVEITLPANKIDDGAGNLNTASNTLSVAYDPNSPTPTLSSTTGANSNASTIPVSVSFSQSVSDFTSSDVVLTNGTISNFSGTGTSYTFDVTPTSDGAVTVSIPAGVAHNHISTPSLASNTLTFNIDRVAPSLTLSAPTPSSGGSSTSFVWTVAYTGATTISLSTSDIVLTGANAGCSSSIAGTGNTRTITVTGCSGNGTTTLSLLGNTAQDAAGNQAPTAGPSAAITISNTVPSVTIGAASTSLGNSSTAFTWPLTYANATTVSLSSGDITLDGTTTGCIATVSGTGNTSRTVSVTGCSGNGTLSISVKANTAQDSSANQAAAAGPSGLVTLDNTAPTLAIATPNPLLGNSATSFSWEVTYSGADVITLSSSDVTLSGTAASGCTKTVTNTSAFVRTVTISNCSNSGTVEISIAANSAHDDAGNQAAAAGPSTSITVNNSALTTTLSSTSGTETKLSSIPVTITFANSVTGFTSADIALSNATLSGFTGSGATYSFNLIPSADGTITASVAAGVAQDSFGTSNEASNTLTFHVDRIAPTLSIGTPTPLAGRSTTSFSWVITYMGANSISLAAGDISLSGATAGCTPSVTGTGNTARTVSVSGCTGNGALNISIAANTATDLAGNEAASAGPSSDVTLDNIGPTLAIGTPSPLFGKSSSSFVWDITYTDATTISLVPANISFTGASAGCTAAVSGSDTTTRTVTVTGCTGNGTLAISVASNSAQDSLGNASVAAGPSNTVTVDNTAPTLAIGTPSPLTGKSTTSFVWVITYTNADTISLTDSDITLSGASTSCTASVSGSGSTSRTVTVTGCEGDGSLTLSVKSNTAQDQAGNQALAAGPSTAVTVDNTGPTLAFSAPSLTIGNSTKSFAYTLTYSGASTLSLSSSDISFVGTDPTGCSAAVTGSGTTTRTVTITGCTGNGTLGISVLANTAQDALGNQAASNFTAANITVDNIAPTLSIGAPSLTLGNSSSTFTWVVTYSGASTYTLAAANVTLNGATTSCTKTVSGTGTSRTITVKNCSGNGDLSISIAANTASDAAGNSAPAEGPSASVTVDNTGPAISISAPSPAVGNSSKTFSWEVTYTDATTINLVASYVTLTGTTTGCTKAVTGSGLITRTVTVSGCTGGLGAVGITIAADSARDSLQNKSILKTGESAVVDNTAPTIAFSSPAQGSTISNVANFAVSGTCSEVGRTLTFNPAALATVTCISGGTWSANFDFSASPSSTSVSIDVAATDEAGNSATATRSFMTPAGVYKVVSIASTETAFAALRSDGSVVNWGQVSGFGSVSANLKSGVVKVLGTSSSFAALKANGSVVTWGSSSTGGDSSGVSTAVSSGVVKIFGNSKSFVALKADGSVAVWGNASNGGDASAVASQLTSGVLNVFACPADPDGGGGAAYAVLKSDGSVVAWGGAFAGGDSSAVASQLTSDVTTIASTSFAFAALKSDGSVVTWGGTGQGGDSSAVTSSLTSGVASIASTARAFAALKSDGSVITWGQSNRGGDSSSVASSLASGVVKIFSNTRAFAALKSDGSIVTWGDTASGGDSSSVSSSLTGVKEVFGNDSAFAALKSDGSLITWGDSNAGGDSTAVASSLSSGVLRVFKSYASFAAIKADGSVVTWGTGSGADSSAVASSLTSGVIDMSSTNGAFAAWKSDGTVVTWGNSSWGGSKTSVSSDLAGTKAATREISNTYGAFAALKTNGSVITWGDSYSGGDSSAVASSLASGVKKVYSSYNGAFAALKTDGSVVAWGASSAGGDTSAVAASLTSVTAIFSNYNAFAALKSNGAVVTWGGIGGDSSAVTSSLNSGVTRIAATNDGFAAIKTDGSVVTWGGSGGDSSSVAGSLSSGVVDIVGSEGAFAALKADGSVVAWGGIGTGGDSSAVAGSLTSGVVKVFATKYSFAALKSDGSVITWGHSSFGGDKGSAAASLTSGVSTISSTDDAFAALKTNGSVVTWGSSSNGGNSSAVSAKLASDVIKLYSNREAFMALKSNGTIVAWGNSSSGGNTSTDLSGFTGIFQISNTRSAFAMLKSNGSVSALGDSSNGGSTSAVASSLTSDVVRVFSTDHAFAAVKADGSVVTWGNSSLGGTSTGIVFKD